MEGTDLSNTSPPEHRPLRRVWSRLSLSVVAAVLTALMTIGMSYAVTRFLPDLHEVYLILIVVPAALVIIFLTAFLVYWWRVKTRWSVMHGVRASEKAIFEFIEARVLQLVGEEGIDR